MTAPKPIIYRSSNLLNERPVLTIKFGAINGGIASFSGLTGFAERLPKSRLFVTRPNVASHYWTFGRSPEVFVEASGDWPRRLVTTCKIRQLGSWLKSLTKLRPALRPLRTCRCHGDRWLSPAYRPLLNGMISHCTSIFRRCWRACSLGLARSR